jgi:nucleotide-binding universal stress UspA family protein
MNRFQELLLDLPLDGSEEGMVRWGEHLARLSGAQRLRLVHVWESLDIPKELKSKYPWLIQPGEDLLRERLTSVVDRCLSAEWREKTEIILKEGARLPEILRFARDEEVDLIVSDKIPEASDGGAYLTRLVRKAPCAVLGLDPQTPFDYTTILTPVDYSTHSSSAVDFAAALARARRVASITALRCFTVPSGFDRTGLPRDAFREEYRDFEEERMAQFLSTIPMGDVQLQMEVVEVADAALGIVSNASRIGAHFIVVGARGKHAASATFLGGTAETILREAKCSVLVIKPKGAGLGLLESLLRL